MKQFVRKVKDNVLLFSEGERLVRDATSNEPWGASSTMMHQIADLTCQREHYESVTNMLWKRLTDVTYPRHVLKACLLVEFLLRNGSERFVHDMKQRRRRFEALSKFTDYAENPEIGADVRAKTVQILNLLDDDAKRNEERVTAARTKAKINGMGNTSNNSRMQSSGSQRRDDWSNDPSNGFQEPPSSNRDNHNRRNSDDSFNEKFGKMDSKSKNKEKNKPEKDSNSFGFDDDPLDDDDVQKNKDKQKASKKDTEAAKEASPVSEKKKKNAKNPEMSTESKPKKDKKKKKKENKQEDSEEAAGPDPPSGHEDIGDFVSADKPSGRTKQMNQMSFEASFDFMDDISYQQGQNQQQQRQKKQPQAQQSPASFDFFSSLENQTISPNSATQNEWFDSKPTAKTPETSSANGNIFFEDFQSASTVPAKITPNHSPAQTAKKPEDLWSSLTNIDSLTAPKPQQPVLSKTAPPLSQTMGQQQYDAFSIGMMGANPQVTNQAVFNNNGFYNGYQQGPQQPQYGIPYGQGPQQPMHPMMMQNNPYQQAFVNPSQQAGFAGTQMPAQQQKPQSNLNIPDAFAAFGSMSK